MIVLNLVFQKVGDKPIISPERMAGRKAIEVEGPITVGVHEQGTVDGHPSISFVVERDKEVIVLPTTARLFCTAAKAVMARYPDLFDDGPKPN